MSCDAAGFGRCHHRGIVDHVFNRAFSLACHSTRICLTGYSAALDCEVLDSAIKAENTHETHIVGSAFADCEVADRVVLAIECGVELGSCLAAYWLKFGIVHVEVGCYGKYLAAEAIFG